MRHSVGDYHLMRTKTPSENQGVQFYHLSETYYCTLTSKLRNSSVRPFNWKLLNLCTFKRYCLLCWMFKVALIFKSVDNTLVWDHSNESYWTILSRGIFLCLMFKVALIFKSVDETQKCNHSNESYWAVLLYGTVHCAVQSGSNSYICGKISSIWPFT